MPRSLVCMSDVPKEIRISPADVSVETDMHPTAQTLEDTERETIRRSLEKNDGRRKATARELNISERTLYRKIKEYGLE
jgi:transcriptional regulator with PAS, ATPase and Fis domain